MAQLLISHETKSGMRNPMTFHTTQFPHVFTKSMNFLHNLTNITEMAVRLKRRVKKFNIVQ